MKTIQILVWKIIQTHRIVKRKTNTMNIGILINQQPHHQRKKQSVIMTREIIELR